MVAKKYLVNYGVALAFWSFADGVSRRLKFHKIYKLTSRMREKVCKEYIRNNYSATIEKYVKDDNMIEDNKIEKDSNVWTVWWQGANVVPFPVEYCIESMKKGFMNRNVIVVDKYNYENYIDIPEYILNKVENGGITLAHLADYIRMCLLQKYGGVWIDSTFYVGNWLTDDLHEYNFYSINHGGYRNWVASKDLWSIGYLACPRNYVLARFCKEIFEEYWKKEPVEIAYLFSDYIISIAYENIKQFRIDVKNIPVNNPNCFLFSKIGNEKYDSVMYERLKRNGYLFQLSYKKNWNIEGTFFNALINNI